MSSLQGIIQYFHDCYRSDNRELTIFDFLDRKIENKIYFEDKEELINNSFPFAAIDSEKAIAIQKKLRLFNKEKDLIYASFFVLGNYTDFRGEVKQLCAPLFYYPAKVFEKEEFHYVSIDASERQINYPLIQLLTRNGDGDILSDPLFQRLPKDYIRFEHLTVLAELCAKYFPDLDFNDLYSFPDLTPVRTVKKILSNLKNNSDRYILAPASMLGIIAKSGNARGVLGELKELTEQKDYSLPLKVLFKEKTQLKSIPYSKGHVPIILSEAQQSLVKSASTHPLSLIVGPPGTGKSYTIGAIALEHMSRGESVLIASRTDEAVDVLNNKLKSQSGIDSFIIRAGRKRQYATPLRRYLKALLTRNNTLRLLEKEFATNSRIRDSRSLEKLIFNLNLYIQGKEIRNKELEYQFARETNNEKKWGKFLSQEKKDLWSKLRKEYLDIWNRLQTPIWELTEELKVNDDYLIDQIQELLKLEQILRIEEVLRSNWSEVMKFNEGIKTSSHSEKIRKFNHLDFKEILKAFPVWLCNLSDLAVSLPMQKEMFDVVIIDEATQCDIASCLPLIQRAKRVVFAGDPNQLRHISFLSGVLQSIFREKYELEEMDNHMLNYRDHSVLDLVIYALESPDQLAMLDEHFRSLEPIISFSNHKFYNGDLRIMTSRPDNAWEGLNFIFCDGKRNKKGINDTEASIILTNIRKMIDEEESLSKDLSSSIGLLSPFRAQVDYLSDAVLKNFSMDEIDKHDIRVGTAYSFQGEERDVMHISLAVDEGSHHSAFVHINKEDVFNVSITRARTQQNIYYSIPTDKVKRESLLYDYLIQNGNTFGNKNSQEVNKEKFLNEVMLATKNWKIDFKQSSFNLAGLKVDLLFKIKDKYYGIDLIGYPGEFSGIIGAKRYRILNRAGVSVFPLPYSDWVFEKEKTLLALKKYLFSN